MMQAVVEYKPAKNEKETEKMVDELRALGLEELRISMLESNKSIANKK